jgi:hypothetical protein
LQDLPAADMAELPDLGAGFNTSTAWRHEVANLGQHALPAAPDPR